MIMTALRPGAPVVICNERKALILENTGDADGVRLRLRAVLERADGDEAEIGTRARRGAPEDPHDGFMGDLASELERRLRAGPHRWITIVAVPRLIIRLRVAAAANLRRAIVALERDYVGLPITEIERRLGRPQRAAESAA